MWSLSLIVCCAGQLKAMDLVEVNPTLGTASDQQKTVQSAIDIIAACFGKRSMYVPPGYQLPDLRA